MMSHSHCYSLPSKTFLLGEYLALQKGPSIIYTCAPFFSLNIHENNLATHKGIHPDSPAGKLIRDHSSLSQCEIIFSDPHQQRGGFGASSAQFAALYRHIYGFSCEPSALKKLLDCYRHYATTNPTMPPSGADVIAQLNGDISIFDEHDFSLEKMQWPFADITIEILATGNKLATHEHLQQLTDIPHNQLHVITTRAIKALHDQNADQFLHCISAYQHCLSELQLMAPTTQQLIETIAHQNPFLAAKGCGAMGADTLVIFRKKS